MATGQNGDNIEGVEIVQLEPQTVLVIRATVPIALLGEAVGERIQALRDYLQQHSAQGVNSVGPPFVHYHTFGDVETDFEFGVPVEWVTGKPATADSKIVVGDLRGGRAVGTWHFGPHIKLGEAYSRVSAFIEEHGLEPSGPMREVYHWIDFSQDEDDLASDPPIGGTQLVQPIK